LSWRPGSADRDVHAGIAVGGCPSNCQLG
jgi:hypothetical protein